MIAIRRAARALLLSAEWIVPHLFIGAGHWRGWPRVVSLMSEASFREDLQVTGGSLFPQGVAAFWGSCRCHQSSPTLP